MYLRPSAGRETPPAARRAKIRHLFTAPLPGLRLSERHVKCTTWSSSGAMCQKGLMPISGRLLRLLSENQYTCILLRECSGGRNNTNTLWCCSTQSPRDTVAPGLRYTFPSTLRWLLICLIQSDRVVTPRRFQFSVVGREVCVGR